MSAQQDLPLPSPAASNTVVINARRSLRIEADQRAIVVAGLPGITIALTMRPPRPTRWCFGYTHGEYGGAAGPFVEEYIYRNAAGRLHMEVVRMTAKTFPTYHWSNGEWVAGWPSEAVPYRLPERRSWLSFIILSLLA